MKKLMLAAFLAVILCTGTAMAYTISYNDNYANWPGWFIDPRDEIGTPHIQNIQGVTLTITDDTNKLVQVDIYMTGRRTWDALFINADWDGTYDDYQSWDYYILDTTLDNTGGSIYAILGGYNYIPATQVGSLDGRWGHPAGIDVTNQNPLGSVSITWNGVNKLTYASPNPGEGLLLGEHFVIGYSPWCANDVFLTPVPEPSMLLLLGLGLLGAGLAGKKLRKK